MVVKGSVWCKSYTGPVVLTTYLFKCSSEPAGTSYADLIGLSGCTVYDGVPTTLVVVTPGQLGEKFFSIAVADAGRDLTKWYVGATEADIAKGSISQVIDPDPS